MILKNEELLALAERELESAVNTALFPESAKLHALTSLAASQLVLARVAATGGRG